MHGDIKYLKLKDVKRGDRFVEEDRGLAVLCEATEDAHEVHEKGRAGWLCRVKPIRGDTPMTDENGLVTLFECFNPGGYGLNLYQEVDPDAKPAPSAATETPSNVTIIRDTTSKTPLCDRLQQAFMTEGTSGFYAQLEKLKVMERKVGELNLIHTMTLDSFNALRDENARLLARNIIQKSDLASSQQRCERLEAIIEKIAAAFDRWKYGQCSDVDFHDIVKRALTKEPR